MQGFQSLAEGQLVEFERVRSPGSRPYSAQFVKVI
jgi:cold shock CspA family protein